MNDLISISIAFVAGLALGVFFFGGLWLTVQRGAASEHPTMWFVGSLLLRMPLVITGFYFVSDGDWRRLLICLVGFVVARLFVMRQTRSAAVATAFLTGQSSHAP